MFQGAVFFDFDGTLTEENKGIYRPTEGTCAAVRQLKEKGYLVGLATGRSKCYVPDVDIDFDCYVTTNGAHAAVRGQTVWNDTMAPEKLREFTKFLRENRFNYILENQERCYCYDLKEFTMRHMVDTFQLPWEVFEELKDDDYTGLNINKLVLTFDSYDRLTVLLQAYGAEYEITAHRTCTSCDVARKGINKAVGIEKVLRRLGIPREKSYAFGDGENDAEMFQLVGTAVAMRDHAAVLDKYAAYVTKGVADDGILYGLQQLGLI